jgi:hypothetical protein
MVDPLQARIDALITRINILLALTEPSDSWWKVYFDQLEPRPDAPLIRTEHGRVAGEVGDGFQSDY